MRGDQAWTRKGLPLFTYVLLFFVFHTISSWKSLYISNYKQLFFHKLNHLTLRLTANEPNPLVGCGNPSLELFEWTIYRLIFSDATLLLLDPCHSYLFWTRPASLLLVQTDDSRFHVYAWRLECEGCSPEGCPSFCCVVLSLTN